DHFHSARLPHCAAVEKSALPRRPLQGQCAKVPLLRAFGLGETSSATSVALAASCPAQAVETESCPPTRSMHLCARPCAHGSWRRCPHPSFRSCPCPSFRACCCRSLACPVFPAFDRKACRPSSCPSYEPCRPSPYRPSCERDMDPWPGSLPSCPLAVPRYRAHIYREIGAAQRWCTRSPGGVEQ